MFSNNGFEAGSAVNGGATHNQGRGNTQAMRSRRLDDGRQTTSTPGLTIGRLYLAELQFTDGELVSATVESADGSRLVAAAERYFKSVSEVWANPEFQEVPITQISVPVSKDLSMRLVHSGSMVGTPTIVFGFKGHGELPTSRAQQLKLADGTVVTLAHSFAIEGSVAKAVWQTLNSASNRQDVRRASRAGASDDPFERPFAQTA